MRRGDRGVFCSAPFIDGVRSRQSITLLDHASYNSTGEGEEVPCCCKGVCGGDTTFSCMAVVV